MDLSTIIPHIEALIFASDKPLTTQDIVELINSAFGFMEERILLEQVEAAVDGIQEKYNAEFYPFEVRESGGGWQFLTKKEFHQTVGQLNGDKFLKRLSNAALETLAIIAYKQPITKGEVEAIRGVNSDYSVQKLLEKELIVISGRNENLPGKPLVYSTSKAFMDYFGINTTSDLPKIKEVLAEQLIEATVVNSALNAHENQAYNEANIDDKPKAQRELFGEGSAEVSETTIDDFFPGSEETIAENVEQLPGEKPAQAEVEASSIDETFEDLVAHEVGEATNGNSDFEPASENEENIATTEHSMIEEPSENGASLNNEQTEADPSTTEMPNLTQDEETSRA